MSHDDAIDFGLWEQECADEFNLYVDAFDAADFRDALEVTQAMHKKVKCLLCNEMHTLREHLDKHSGE